MTWSPLVSEPFFEAAAVPAANNITPRDASLQFDLEYSGATPPRTRPSLEFESLAKSHAAWVVDDVFGGPSTPAEGNSGEAVALRILENCLQHRAAAPGTDLDHPEVGEIAGALARAGFRGAVVLERSACVLSSRHLKALPLLPFKPFLYVGAFYALDSTIVPMQAIVDIGFRGKFLVHNPSPKYYAALAALPVHYVGCPVKLQQIVTKMCDFVKDEFRSKGLSLPPWRTLNSMLSIWFPVALDSRRTVAIVPKA